MKKVVSVVLCLSVLLSFSCAFASDYSSFFGMNINDFKLKYNSIGSALGSSLTPLKSVLKWTKYNQYNVAWYVPDTKSGVTLLLISADKESGQDESAGLDAIQIFIRDTKDFLSFLTVTTKCVQIFTDDLFGSSLAPFYVDDLLVYYYENTSESNYSAYRSINADQTIFLTFFYSYGDYYFQIGAGETI